MYANTYTANRAYRAAARGAKWMDKNCPGWTLLLNLRKLQMDNGAACILGQTAHCVTNGEVESGRTGSYDNAVNTIVYQINERARKHWTDSTEWAVKYGFYAPGPEPTFNGRAWHKEMDERYAMLTIAWKEEIRKRGEGASA